MPKVIRGLGRTEAAPFNVADMSSQAMTLLDEARAESNRILSHAKEEAVAIRTQAAEEGRRAAEDSIEQLIEQRVAERCDLLRPTLERSFAEFERARRDWLARCETGVVRLATAIARRIMRRELTVQPEIPLALVREALQLAAGSSRMRLLMNPADLQVVGKQVQKLLDEHAGVATAELIAEAGVTPGGCRVQTEHGSIDQQFEAQLARIAEELT